MYTVGGKSGGRDGNGGEFFGKGGFATLLPGQLSQHIPKSAADVPFPTYTRLF